MRGYEFVRVSITYVLFQIDNIIKLKEQKNTNCSYGYANSLFLTGLNAFESNVPACVRVCASSAWVTGYTTSTIILTLRQQMINRVL